jgi:mannose-6-phosphate isomerase-like protein (cupin superfamily)
MPEPANLEAVSKYPYPSQLRLQGREEGRAEGRAEDIIMILDDREIAMTHADRERILACRDLEMLQTWLHRSLTISAIRELFAIPEPVNLDQALAGFTEIYSPRIVARVNDYDVKIAHADGDYVWHVHENTDEFFLVLAGRFDVSIRDYDGERTVTLHKGDVFVVPKGVEHKPSGSRSAILMFEPRETLSTGDRHEGEIPDYVDSTTGHDLR